MTRPRLSDAERKIRKQLSRQKTKQKLRNKKSQGICRDCNNPVCSASTVFCEQHFEKHRATCKKSAKKQGKYKSIRNNSIKKGRFCLSKEKFEDWFDKQAKKCCYCGIKESDLKNHKDKKKKRLTIDRMDNSRGYEKDNICLACFRCNNLKSDFFTETEWREICKKYVKLRLNEYQSYT